LPILKLVLDELVVFFPSQGFHKEEVLRWNDVLETGRSDNDLVICELEICVCLLKVETCLNFLWQLVFKNGSLNESSAAKTLIELRRLSLAVTW